MGHVSIPHIESFPLSTVHSIIENVDSWTITEKLDGTSFTFGLDDQGRLFTRKMWRGDFVVIYDHTRYADVGVDSVFKQVHMFLSENIDAIRRVAPHQFLIEAEILYGPQPNAIVYGDNRLVLLCADNEHVDLDRLAASLDDGEGWFISTAPRIKLHPKTAATIKQLTSVSCPHQIKQRLLDNINNQITPAFRTIEVEDGLQYGIEGVVVHLGDITFKIVDKHKFTTINTYNHAIRNLVKRTSWGDLQKMTPMFYRVNLGSFSHQTKSIYDTMLEDVCDSIGYHPAITYLSATRTLKRFATPADFVESCNQRVAPTEITNILYQSGVDALVSAKHTFLKEAGDYFIVLNNNQTIPYSCSVIKRTAEFFDVVVDEVKTMAEKVANSHSTEEAIHAIFHRQFGGATTKR